MVSLKNKSKGFTIVELLIVIVVIGILATLVIVTFTGIQQKARNSQRQTDINAVDSHVESFFAQYGFYPSYKDLTNATFRASYLKGLDPAALVDPKGNSIASSAAASGTYTYSYTPANSGSGTCAVNTDTTIASDGTPQDNGCDSFTLSSNLEGQSTAYQKKSN
jgi:general secretion pathway protein G